MAEEWLDIEGWWGLYQVSNLGRVRSLPRVVERSNGATQTVKGGFLTPTPTPDGHMQVRLR